MSEVPDVVKMTVIMNMDFMTMSNQHIQLGED